MFSNLKEFFDQFVAPPGRPPGADAGHGLQVAAGALLVEMMRMDGRIAQAEREAVVRALRGKFDLTDAEIDALVELAAQRAREAPGYHPFTSLINQGFGPEQKVRLVECLWQVALADGELDSHEHHYVRKIADLLYVPHRDFIAAKLRAREAAGG